MKTLIYTPVYIGDYVVYLTDKGYTVSKESAMYFSTFDSIVKFLTV